MANALKASWQLAHGASITPSGVHFSVWAPHADRIAVRVHEASGEPCGEHELEPGERGVFRGEVAGAGAGNDYLFVIDGLQARPDPVSRWQPHGVHGASRVVDPEDFAWSDDSWRGLGEMRDYVIYELHTGTFTAEGTFDAIVPHLAALRELGVTALELMPVAEFPGERNWGYDGVHLFAPHSRYGGPDGLKRLVDAAHAHGLAVVLDVVYNHLGPEGNYLDAFGPYFTDRYRTPWGRAVNFDGPGSDAVRQHVIDNACYWVTEFHVDALRLDAVHGIFDASASHVLAELTSAVHERAAETGRTVHLIAESDQNDPRVVRRVSERGLGFDAQWADDLHHAVHAALTGESAGYYADYGDVSAVAQTLREPFLYDGRYSHFRDRVHGASSHGLPRERFIVCAQNHDQVGNRAHGERLATLVSFPHLKLAAALTLLSAYVPLLFMGEEYGETNPFLYFVSHGDAGLAEAVRQGRQEEFAGFAWGASVPDPQDPLTFQRSKLERRRAGDGEHALLLEWYRALLHLRRQEPLLRPGSAVLDVAASDEGEWIRVHYRPAHDGGGDPTGRELCAAFTLGSMSAVPLPAGEWVTLVDSDERRFGGSRVLSPPDAVHRTYDLAAHAAALLARRL